MKKRTELKSFYKPPGADPLFQPLEGETIFDREASAMARYVNATIYCRMCGKELVFSYEDESGGRINPEQERGLQLCTKCMHELQMRMGGYR